MKKRVLQCIGSLGNGGIENFVFNISKNINKDIFDVDCFVLNKDDKYYYKDMIDNKVNIIYSDRNEIKVFKNIFLFIEILKILKKNRYSAIHIHVNTEMIPLLIASKLSKIPIICIHSHSAYSPYWNPRLFNLKSKIKIKLQKIFIKIIATQKLGCSEAACKRLFDNIHEKNVMVIYNGIDIKRFDNRNYDKKEIAKKYNIDSKKKNFIHVGRFDEQKNQIFLLEVFRELVNIRDDIELKIVGYGSLEKDIRKKIKSLNLEDYVEIIDGKSNIPEILSCMDYFLLPSLCEGLGIVLIEAQSMGLQCFASSYIPNEADIGLCEFIDLEIGANNWAKIIDKNINRKFKKSIDKDKLSKYDIKNVTNELEKIYYLK